MGDSLPLSWDEARFRYRKVLEAYLDDSQATISPPSVQQANPPKPNIIEWWIRHDLDLYAGALFLSITLLALSCVSLSQQSEANRVYQAQVVASVLLLFGSAISLWMVRRRRFLFVSDSDTEKRREIYRFLRKLDREKDIMPIKSIDGSDHTSGRSMSDGSGQTSLNDFYPVYRRRQSSNDAPADWTRIPSLLLVEGDWIALQIGDTVPAKCIAVESKVNRSVLDVGETVTLASMEETTQDLLSKLPPGRITLPPGSNHLLTLCNDMRIFTVLEPPISEFIRRKPARYRPSQTSRYIFEIRQILSIIAVIMLLLTALVIFVRPGFASGEIFLVLPMPFLAALGVFPVVGPAFVFFLEMLGTARILSGVHPYASPRVSEITVTESRAFFPKTRLLFRYLFATALSRLSLWKVFRGLEDALSHFFTGSPRRMTSDLVRVPPASLGLLEKLGDATAFCVCDDEIVCEPHAVPQQLLIRSANGLKLLDLCLAYEDESDSDDDSGTLAGKRRGKSYDSDSSDDGTLQTQTFNVSLRRKVRRRRRRTKRRMTKDRSEADDASDSTSDSAFEVQFEDPSWWQYLPSLKCIGLACLCIEEERDMHSMQGLESVLVAPPGDIDASKSKLVRLVCSERRSYQLRALAHCIGFSTAPNSYGAKGDLSPFKEQLRLGILSNALFKERLEIDTHERSSEQCRWWGRIRPDSTSVIVRDNRSTANQLLTIGDPAVVMSLCNEAWQGEISTILPLNANDRQLITEMTNNWKLGDLDVAAFSYSPIPHTLDALINEGSKDAQVYLLDGNVELSASLSRNKNAFQEWNLVRNQVFLGVLGSLIVPRRETQKLLGILNEAGVRFVYFSPRNMRRQKELASQMGIDVAWNCAISLRPLEAGEDDPHRMVSNYADWDVNAKLPHGVEDVQKHLEEVDNVPLLVSLFTDVTKKTTEQMVEIFQDYSDTVVAVGVSHLPWNHGIFSTADISIGIDVLIDTPRDQQSDKAREAVVRSAELAFVSAVSSHSCVFRFRGASSVSHLSNIIEKGRAALEAGTAACVFLVSGCIAFSLYTLLSACVPTTTLPYVPVLGSVLFLQIVLPGLGFTLAMSDAPRNTMKLVPAKNDGTVTFRQSKEGRLLSRILALKSIPPALLPQVSFLIAFGTLVIHFEPDLIATECPGAKNWVSVLRCAGLRDYSGVARTSAGALSLVQFVLCVIVSSTSFVYRFSHVNEQNPCKGNHAWCSFIVIAVGLTSAYAVLATETGTASVLPWYYYLLAVITPFLCLIWNEVLKRSEIKYERRAEKLRRLQFETRLGAWSPK